MALEKSDGSFFLSYINEWLVRGSPELSMNIV
jgi:hypothetical protein